MKKLAPYRQDMDDNRHWSDIVAEQKRIYKEYRVGETLAGKGAARAPHTISTARASYKMNPNVKPDWSNSVVSAKRKMSTKASVKGKKTGWIATGEGQNKKQKFDD
jgi:hypothetical protein